MYFHDPNFNSYDDYYRFALARGNTPLTESAIAFYVSDAVDHGFPIAEMETFLASNPADWGRLSQSFEAYAHETPALVYTGPGNALQTIGGTGLSPTDVRTITTISPTSATLQGQPMAPTASLPSGLSAPSTSTSGPPGAFGYGQSAPLSGGGGGLMAAGIGGIPLWLLIAVGAGVWFMTRKG